MRQTSSTAILRSVNPGPTPDPTVERLLDVLNVVCAINAAWNDAGDMLAELERVAGGTDGEPSASLKRALAGQRARLTRERPVLGTVEQRLAAMLEALGFGENATIPYRGGIAGAVERLLPEPRVRRSVDLVSHEINGSAYAVELGGVLFVRAGVQEPSE